MEFIHRRRLTLPQPQHHSNPFSMHPFPVLDLRDLPGPPLPRPTPPCPPLPIPPLRHTENSAKKELLKTGLIIMATISAAVLIGILYRIFRAKLSRGRDMRRTSDDDGPIIFATQEDFVDGDQGPGMDHHVWFINTVGLHQSVIDSISFFVCRKDENLVEGRTECSVCLSEFQEGESLRLLPKCSHAFHLPCIDTWLRSHKNCPLCRAPIVRGSFDASLGLSVTSTSESSSMEETQIENSDNSGGETREERNGDGGVSVLPVGDETDDVNSNINSSHSVSKNHSQPVRRSVSLDFSSAPAICHTVANFMPQKHEGDSDAHLQPKKSKLESVVAKQGSGRSLSIGRQMISSSIGRSLQKGPISMKRSFSTSGKCTSYRVFRHGKSQDSILPL